MVAGSREARAIEMLAADADGVRKVGPNLWKVRSQSGDGWYSVEFKPATREWICDCADFEGRGDGEPCKHILRAFVDWSPGKDPTDLLRPPKPVRKAYPNPPGYDRAQMAELAMAPIFLKDAIAALVPSDDGPRERGRPPIPLAEKLYCALEKVHWQLSCRRAYGLNAEAASKGFLSKAWNYSVSSVALSDPEMTPYLDRLLALTAAPFAAIEDTFAIDSSGFRTTLFNQYRREKYNPGRRNRWMKAHPIVGVDSHVVPALIVTEAEGEGTGDAPQLPKLLELAVAAGFTIKNVCADPAYLSRQNVDAVYFVGACPFIPFKSNSTARGEGSSNWNRLYHWVQAHPLEFAQGYFKRQAAEYHFSAMKRMFGETLRSRLPVARANELRCKFVLYNVTVLIHGLYEAKLMPSFLRPLWPETGLTSNPTEQDVGRIPEDAAARWQTPSGRPFR